jgi:dipeptidase E
MSAPRLLLLSSSRYGNLPPFAHAATAIQAHFAEVSTVCFIPYAQPGGISYAAYTAEVQAHLGAWGLEVQGLHEALDPVLALQQAEGIFTGGGNTFLLLRTLYEKALMEPLRAAIARGVPYLGSSAGSNLAGLTIGTTNDMPIVYPPSFEALGVIPFNLNPHYPRAEDSLHRGETRDQRLLEFCQVNPQPVLALREDGMLWGAGTRLWLGDTSPGRWFRAGQAPVEIPAGADLPPWT